MSSLTGLTSMVLRYHARLLARRPNRKATLCRSIALKQAVRMIQPKSLLTTLTPTPSAVNQFGHVFASVIAIAIPTRHLMIKYRSLTAMAGCLQEQSALVTSG